MIAAIFLITNSFVSHQPLSLILLHVCGVCPLPYSVNIPVSGGSGDISAGLTRAHYLPPVPPQGTGLHRFVFSLYTHSEPLPQDHTHEVGVVTGEWLQQRLFSSAKFLETAGVTPQTFCFFQCQWDKSVRHTYKNVLSEYSICAVYCSGYYSSCCRIP